MESSDEKKRGKGDKFCPKHPNKELIFSCDDCASDLVCSLCISTEHKGHKFTDLDLLAQEKYKFIQDFKDEVQNEYSIPKIDSIIQGAEISVSRFEITITDDIDRVEGQRQFLKRKVDDIADKNISDLKDILNKYKTLFQEFQLSTENSKKQMQDLLLECEEALNSKLNVFFVDVAKDLKGIKTKPEKFVGIPDVNFNSGSDCERLIEEAFGSIKILNETRSDDLIGARALDMSLTTPITPRTRNEIRSPLAKPLLMKTWKCPCNPSSIQVTKDGTICITGGWLIGRSNKIYLLDIDGNVRQLRVGYLLLDETIHDIAVLPVTDTLYCILNDYSVRLVDRQTGHATRISALRDVKDRDTRYMYINKFDESDPLSKPSSLGFLNDGTMMIGDPIRGQVKVYSPGLQYNQRVKESDYRLNYISKIKVCSYTEKIAIVCKNIYHVVVLDRNFSQIYKYKGPQWQSILPCDVIFDRHGHLLVADGNENIGVHIVNANTGQHIQTLTTEEMGQARCLTINHDGHLVVGISNPRRLLTFKYLE